MARVIRQQCFNHSASEAAARCPGCGRFYCRECVVDFEGRLLCASCVAKLSAAPHFQWRLSALRRFALTVAGFALLWTLFGLLGVALSRIPAKVHSGAWLTTQAEPAAMEVDEATTDGDNVTTDGE
ncbi:MAG: rhomboid family protein [Lentisphaeria bacterium]|jgi:hypothetical protein